MEALGALAGGIDRLNRVIGRITAWFALFLVLTQFAIVVLRYVFGIGNIALQESLLYQHSILFLLGAGYTLLTDGHVRIDIFYREATAERKAAIDLAGVFVFLWPVCAVIGWTSWPYVRRSWAVLEGSKETSGIQAVFLLKSLIAAFALLLAIQGLSLAIHSARILLHRERPAPPVEHERP